MTKELQAQLSTGSTLYAILLNSVGQIWNGSAFETVNGANWATYDIALTESIAGLYTADMPAVVAGVYSYVVYEQAGGSPANTDEWTGNGYLEWDGTAVLPMSTIDTNVDDIETILGTPANFMADVSALGTPANFKADVSALALEATLTAIKGAGWTTETLKALKDAIDTISVSGATAKEVWEYAHRSLTWMITETAGNSITVVRGNTWIIDITDIILYTHKQQVAIKKNAGVVDAMSYLLIDSEDGLIILDGDEAEVPTDAYLTYDEEEKKLTITVKADATVKTPVGIWLIGIQSINEEGDVSENYQADFNIIGDIVRKVD